jgi:hypothetical protein
MSSHWRLAHWVVWAFILTSAALCQNLELSVPRDMDRLLVEAKAIERFEPSPRLNPFYLRADFDGDGRPDYAILMIDKAAKKEVVVILLSSVHGYKIITDKTSDRAFDGWEVCTKGSCLAEFLREHPARPPLPRIAGDAIVFKFGGPGVLTFWTGRGFRELPWGE